MNITHTKVTIAMLTCFTLALLHTNVALSTETFVIKSFDEVFDSLYNGPKRIKYNKAYANFTFRVEKTDDSLTCTIQNLTSATRTNNTISQPDSFSPIIQGTAGADAKMLFASPHYMGFFSRRGAPSTQDQTRLIIIPLQKKERLTSLDKAELTALLNMCNTCAAELGSPNAYTIEINNGPLANQQVPYVHAHLTVTHNPSLATPIINFMTFSIWDKQPFNNIPKLLQRARGTISPSTPASTLSGTGPWGLGFEHSIAHNPTQKLTDLASSLEQIRQAAQS